MLRACKMILRELLMAEGATVVMTREVQDIFHTNIERCEIAEQAGAKVEVLCATGGAANSLIWTQIKADVTGKTILVPASDTATTWGAAVLAGVGAGVFASYEEAVAGSIQHTRRHDPDPSKAEVYAEQYEIYRKLYPALKNM